MKEILKRIITGAVLIPTVLFIFYISGIPLLLFIILFMGGGMLEYLNLYRIQSYFSLVAISLTMIVFYFFDIITFFYFVVILFLLYVTIFLVRWQRGYSFEKFTGELFVLLYLILGGIFIFLIRNDLSFKYLLLFFVSVWVYDTGAFLFGKTLGRHKLASRISPAKTMEGVIFGFFTLLGSMLVFSYLQGNEYKLTFEKVLYFSLLMSYTCTVGDLIESVWKREQGKKDSSNLFPGHGGILDRIDSLILSAPFYYFFFKLFS